MRNLKKTFVSLVLSGACALSLTAAACDSNTSDGGDTTHTHTYESTWTYNSTQHWHAATCGDDAKDAQGDHVDANNDGVCDTCGFNYAHTHVYSDEWTADANNHWHASLCGHEVTSDSAAHTADIMGVCTVCGYKVSQPVIADIEDALEIAEYNSSIPEHAEGTYTTSLIDYAGQPRSSEYEISYDKYEDFTYVNETFHGSYGDTVTETWYSQLSNGSMYSVVSEDGSTPSANTDGISENDLKGYAFTNPLNDNFAAGNGLEEFASTIYYFLTENYTDAENDTVEVTEPSAENEAYTVTFSRYTIGYTQYVDEDNNLASRRDQSADTYLEGSLSFTINDSYYMDSLTFEATIYGASSLKFPADDTEAKGTLIENPTPENEYTYEFTQGSRNPYDSDVIFYTDYTLKLVETDEETDDEIKTNVTDGELDIGYGYDNRILVAIDDAEPETVEPSIDRISYQVYLYDETLGDFRDTPLSSTEIYSYMQISNYYDYTTFTSDPTRFYIHGQAEGTYKIVFSTIMGVEHTLTVTVEKEDPTSIEAQVNGSSADTYNGYTGLEYTITGDVGSAYKEGYTVAITSDNAASASITERSTGWIFTTETAGTYTLTVTSTVVTTLSDTVTMVIAEAPEMSDVLNGNYEFDINDNFFLYSNGYIGFTPESEGALNGSLKFYFDTWEYGLIAGTVTYSYNAEEATIDIVDDVTGYDEFIVTIAADYSISVTLRNTSGYGLTLEFVGATPTEIEVPDAPSGGEEGGEDVDIATAILGDKWYNASGDYSIIFEADTSGEISSDTIYWGAVYIGSSYNYRIAVIYFEWSVDENGDIITTPVSSAYSQYFTDNDPEDQLTDFEAGLIATYNQTANTISFAGYTFNMI